MEAAVASGSQITMGSTVVRLVRDDITEMDVDAFVFYATEDLALGSGFGGMIAMRAGAVVQKELDAMGPVGPLTAVVSGAGKLNAEQIIHVVGPRFREDDIEAKLKTSMVNCLMLAEEKGIKTLAFPAMGAGYYGIPAPVSAKVMLGALNEFLSGETGLSEVTICLLDRQQFNAFDVALKAASNAAPAALS